MELEIYTLSPDEVTQLMADFSEADFHKLSVRVCIDGGLKVKVAEGTWTAPLGVRD